MSLKFRGMPMFAPDGADGSGGGDDSAAQMRIAIRKAKEEARKAATETVSDLLEDAGFKDMDEFKAVLKSIKKGGKPEAKPDGDRTSPPVKSEAEVAAERAAAEKAVADKAAADAKASELYNLKLQMAVAGVKVDDLEWAAGRFMVRKGELPPSGVAGFTVDTFVTELKAAHPASFRDTQVGGDKGAGGNAGAGDDKGQGNTGAGSAGNTGNNNQQNAGGVKPPTFNALNAKPEEVSQRLAEIMGASGN